MWIQTPDPNSHVGLIGCKADVCRLFPENYWLFSFPFFPPFGTRRSAWKKKNGNCNYSSKLHELKLLVFFIYILAANCTSFNYLEYWNFGHTLVQVDGVTTSKSISCENYVLKYWGDLCRRLPKYCYFMYNQRKSTLRGTLDFDVSPHAVQPCLLYTSPSPRD